MSSIHFDPFDRGAKVDEIFNDWNDNDGRAPNRRHVAERRPHNGQDNEQVAEHLGEAAADEEEAVASGERTPWILASEEECWDEDENEEEDVEPGDMKVKKWVKF